MLSVIALILAVGVSPAAAQRRARARVPAAGSWAIGGSIGVALPSDPSLDQGLDVADSIEGDGSLWSLSIGLKTYCEVGVRAHDAAGRESRRFSFCQVARSFHTTMAIFVSNAAAAGDRTGPPPGTFEALTRNQDLV
jgi:hypothetical protein